MITNKGKNVIAKYMIGHAPAYASYISFGCGAIPKSNLDILNPLDYENYESMSFEMFRSPIISRGYVTENIVDENGDVVLDQQGNPEQFSEIVFTAQLPTEERYEITEVGVWSAGANPSAASNDSKVLFSFSETENWEYHTSTTSSTVQKIATALDAGNENNTIDVEAVVFEADSDNTALDTQIRYERNERPRFLNNSLFIRGDMSVITGTGNNISVASDQPHVHLNGTSVNLDRNSGSDEIKIAFSIINKFQDNSNPTAVKVIVEFSPPEDSGSAQYARLKASLVASGSGFADNRYFVVTSKLDDIEKTQEFSWQAVGVIKIYVSVLDGTDQSEDYYVALDAIRIDNVTTVNPLYGMVGYTVVKTEDGLPIIKLSNSSNLLEFRFGMDVQ